MNIKVDNYYLILDFTFCTNLALEKDNYDIYNYLINYPGIEICAFCFSNSKNLMFQCQRHSLEIMHFLDANL